MKKIDSDELKDIQLEILKEVDSFCINNDIDYIVYAGSLIGLVRHGGYIPWDDDIDIAMPRPSYDRFINEFKHPYLRVQSYEKNDSFMYTFSKVDDVRTVLIEDKRYKSEIGVNIDIFPLDALPSSTFIRNIYVNLFYFLFIIINIKQIKIKKQRALYKNIIIIISRLLLMPFTYKTLVGTTIKLSKLLNYNKANYVGNMAWGFGKKEIMVKGWVSKIERMKFETIYVNAPIFYDEVLTQKYGDYMLLPPEEQRSSHHAFQAYYKD